MSRFLVLTLAMTALAFGQSVSANASDKTSKINGSISIDAGKTVGDLDTVNGSIRLGDNGQADKISTVNGSITVGDNAKIRSAGTVNGRITLGQRSQTSSGIDSVNGSLTLEQGAMVNGDISNVNGTIRLIAAHVGGSIETVKGDIDIGADSTIDGGIRVNKSHSWFRWGAEEPVDVVIGPRAVVKGSLVFERDVKLFVSDTAQISEVKGAKVVKFSGDHP